MCKKRVIYTMSELNLALMSCFNKLNDHYFSGELEKVIITLEEGYKKGAYGWIRTVRDWKQGDSERYHINISCDFLDRSADAIIATLLHEMCHLYALQNNIQDTSRAGIYHNKRFKEIAEKHGLIAVQMEHIGYTTECSPELSEWVANNCPFTSIRVCKKKEQKGSSATPKPKQSSRKYVCPCCGLIVRATKDCNIMCMDCDEQMEIEN